MPPKKTKPNEKCPCGSGKKHKKCCMVAGQRASSAASAVTSSATITTTVLDEMMEALALTTTTTPAAATITSDIGRCFHGSTSDHFSDGRAYRDIIQDYLAEETVNGLRTSFEESHWEYFHDLQFAQYIFALCTSWYLKTNQLTPEMKDLLIMAMKIKYIYMNDGKFNADQVKRYVRAIFKNDDRNVINCLSRETKSYCNCMKDKKTEADGMEKTEFCYGCHTIVPREGMLKCSGCNFAMFCTDGCYDKHWPKHREVCKTFKLSNAMLRETSQSRKNEQNE